MLLRPPYALLAATLLLSACTPALNPTTARQTAVAGGCWPEGAGQPATATPMETPGVTPPAATAYPECTPVADAPTRTTQPTRTATYIPQATAQVPGGVLQGETEIGDQPGYASARTVAVSPRDGTAAVGWVSWGANRLDDSHDGRVWVRVQTAEGIWSPLQSINTRPVKKFFGGLGLAIGPDNSVYAAFGAGGSDGDNQLYVSESRDRGMSWSQPAPIGATGAAPPMPPAMPTTTATTTTAPSATAATPAATQVDFTDAEHVDGGVLALRSDAAGGLHLLYLTAEGGYHLGYAYRSPGAAMWQLGERLEEGAQYGGQLAVLSGPGGQVRRFVAVRGADGRRLTLYRSDDGQRWRGQQLELNHFLNSETVIATSVLAVPRGDSALVAVAWSQYAAGGVFAQISLDGGETWGGQEQIAQHNAGGRLFGEDGTGLRAGFEPSLAYEGSTDQLVASWVELDLGPRPILGRTLLAARPLAAEPASGSSPWHYAITPERHPEETPPQLSPMGVRGALVGSPDGRTHWLLTLDERNEQYRLAARRVNLAGLLAPDPS